MTENVTRAVPGQRAFSGAGDGDEPRSRQVTENVTRQYTVNVPVQVPVTVMKYQPRQVTENVTEQVPVTT